LQHPGIDGRIMLKWIFKKWDGVAWYWIDLAQDRDRLLSYEHGNEPTDSIKCREFLALSQFRQNYRARLDM
jgi:hypothetical protein